MAQEEEEDRREGGEGRRDPDNPVIGDDDRPVGDTSEAHDEINPHDLPIDHPGRQEAERQAAGLEGTTRGHEDPSRAASEAD